MEAALSGAYSRAYWNRFTDEREHEWLRHAHDGEVVVGIAGRVDVSRGARNAHAEQIARHAFEGRIDPRVLAFGVGSEAVMRFTHERLHLRRQAGARSRCRASAAARATR